MLVFLWILSWTFAYVRGSISYGCSENYEFLSTTSRCYGYFNTPSTNQEAKSQCTADGGHLAEVKLFDVHSLAVDLRSKKGNPTTNAWIGLRFDGSNWFWMHTYSQVEFFFTHWLAATAPNDVTRQCGVMVGSDDGSYWTDFNCFSQAMGFVCEKGKQLVVSSDSVNVAFGAEVTMPGVSDTSVVVDGSEVSSSCTPTVVGYTGVIVIDLKAEYNIIQIAVSSVINLRNPSVSFSTTCGITGTTACWTLCTQPTISSNSKIMIVPTCDDGVSNLAQYIKVTFSFPYQVTFGLCEFIAVTGSTTSTTTTTTTTATTPTTTPTSTTATAPTTTTTTATSSITTPTIATTTATNNPTATTAVSTNNPTATTAVSTNNPTATTAVSTNNPTATTTTATNNPTATTTTATNNPTATTTTATNNPTATTTTTTNNSTATTTTANNNPTATTTTATNNPTATTTTATNNPTATTTTATNNSTASTSKSQQSTPEDSGTQTATNEPETSESNTETTSILSTSRVTTTTTATTTTPTTPTTPHDPEGPVLAYDDYGRPVRKKCTCRCKVPALPTVREAAEQKAVEIKGELVVEKDSLSKEVAKKVSRADERKSSVAIGQAAIVLLILPVALIVLPDIFTVLTWFCKSR